MTSSDASCAPPPQTIIGRFAAPSRFAALRIALVVDLRLRAAARALRASPAPALPQTSIAHSSAAGPGRPVDIARNACAIRREAVCGAADARGMIDQPRDDAGLVADFVQMAEAAADVGLGNLADQRQHRRVHRIGGEQRGRELSRPGPGTTA